MERSENPKTPPSGKLILVPTPIGNLGDMTPRAVEVLQEADLVLAEDTRTSGNLANKLGISVQFQSFHAHNEHGRLESVLEQLKTGKVIALVSDAGTPAISDPGFLLVRACIQGGIHLECLPGATAFVPALVLSGFPSDRFVFEGFLPHKKGRQTRLAEMASEKRTMVLYESPFRITKLLQELADHGMHERKVSISRELSKKFEETIRGYPSELLEHFSEKPPKGEFVVVIEGAG